MDFKVIKTPKRRMNGLSSSIVVNIFLVETINDCKFVLSFLFELKYFTFLVSEGDHEATLLVSRCYSSTVVVQVSNS